MCGQRASRRRRCDVSAQSYAQPGISNRELTNEEAIHSNPGTSETPEPSPMSDRDSTAVQPLSRHNDNPNTVCIPLPLPFTFADFLLLLQHLPTSSPVAWPFPPVWREGANRKRRRFSAGVLVAAYRVWLPYNWRVCAFRAVW